MPREDIEQVQVMPSEAKGEGYTPLEPIDWASLPDTQQKALDAVGDWSHGKRFLDGSIIETIDVDVIEDGGLVKLQLQADGGGDLRCRFAGQSYVLVCAPLELELTVGTDAAPQINYVYVTEAAGVLTLDASTDDWPAVPYCAIASVLVQSAASLANDGAFKVHVWTDHFNHATLNGMFTHITKKLRGLPATWKSGVSASNLVVADPDAYISTTEGVVFQLHEHTMPAIDMETPAPVYLVNDPTTKYKRITTFDDITQDASAGAINNKYMNLVLWGAVSENSADCKLFINLPTATYTVEATAMSDDAQTAVYSFPDVFVGTAFLIARYTVKAKDAGEWSQSQKVDLRGLFPSSAAGGGLDTTHTILDGSIHTDSVTQAVAAGALMYGNATPAWDKHPLVTLDAAGVMSGLTELAMGAHDITALAFAHVGPGGGIKSNTLGNIELGFQAFTIGAVNYLYIISAWAGAAPSLTVEGADANIDLALGGKGTGIVKSLDDFDVTGNITVSGLVDGVDIAGTVVTAGANLTDNAVLRGDGGALGIQTSLAILSDAGALSGLTQLDVDNIRIDGNTISSTDLSTIYLDPGTTEVQINTLGAAAGNQFALIMANSVWNAAMIDTRTSFSFWQAYTAGGDMWSTAQITAGTETNWTAVANSQDGYLAFYTTLNAVPAEKMRITSAGVVGINTDDPGGIHGSAMLDIRKDALCAIALYSFVAAATNDSRVFAARARGVDGAPAIVQNGAPPDSLFTFQSLGYDGAGYTTGAIMSFVVDGAPGVGVMPAAIVFKTAAGAPVERLRIQSDGDMLVDTDSKMMFRDSDLYWYSPGDGILHGDADTRISLEAPTVKVTATAFEVSNTNGIDIGISVDGDVDLITVDVTGAPRYWWDESTDAFVMTHRLDLTAGGVQTQYAVDDVADPPTDAELDAAFGDPTVVGPGFVGILDDGGAGLYCYICFTTGTAGEWFYIAGAKAV